MEHPRGYGAGTAAPQLDEDDLAIGKSLAPLHSQALSVEGVPTIIDGNDFNLPKMMGIMRLARRIPSCPTINAGCSAVLVLLALSAFFAAAQETTSLRGTVTDPFGADSSS